VSNGTINDLTNPIFNGTFTVSAVDAPNSKVFYTLTGTPADVASGATAGTVSNTTNLIFNGTSIPITATPTTKTLQYAKTHADVVESASTGTVVDRTNIDVFNGAHIITAVPSYNTLTYTKTASNVTATAVPTSGADATIAPTASKALLTVKYRSGWAG
jgi:hypothetical protein